MNETTLALPNKDIAAVSLISKEPGEEQIAHVPSTTPSLWTKLNFWSRIGSTKDQEGKGNALANAESSKRTSLGNGPQQTDMTMKIPRPRDVPSKESTAISWWPTWK